MENSLLVRFQVAKRTLPYSIGAVRITNDERAEYFWLHFSLVLFFVWQRHLGIKGNYRL